jgi:hypothetical protein
MTNKRSGPFEISPKKAAELSKLLRMVSEQPISTHLSEDQFVGYVTGDLSEEEMLEIDRHLEICDDCGTQIEYLAMNAMTWSGPEGRQRLKELRGQTIKKLDEEASHSASFLEVLAFQVKSLLSGTNLAAGMVQAATEEKKDFKQGEQWSCFLDMDRRGNYILRISSHDLSLEGMQLRLVSKNWQREIMLNRVDPNQVGAKVVLSPEDLTRIPQGHDFSVELIRRDPESE